MQTVTRFIGGVRIWGGGKVNWNIVFEENILAARKNLNCFDKEDYCILRGELTKVDFISTSSPGPSPRRFSKWRIVGRRPWQRLGHVVQNLQKSWRFLSRDFWERPEQNGGEAWEATYRSKNGLTLYTRQWWLRSKIKYYFNGCFDSGAGLFSICKFIPLSYSLYF